MGKKIKDIEIIDPKKYYIKICCYDLFNEIWNEYPRTKELPALTIISVAKNHEPVPEAIEEISKYEGQISKYFNPALDESIIEIAISNMPRKVLIEEWGLTQFDAENRDFYYIDGIKYKLNKENLYKFYLSSYFNYQEWDSKDWHVADHLSEHIIKKIIGIQPTISRPNKPLSYLSYLSFLIKDKNWMKDALVLLNDFKRLLPRDIDAFSAFISDGYYSIENHLANEKVISICKNCGSVLKYQPDKKYCNAGCRKRAESRRYYGRYRDKLRKLKKIDMRDTRKLYKKLGVKKHTPN